MKSSRIIKMWLTKCTFALFNKLPNYSELSKFEKMLSASCENLKTKVSNFHYYRYDFKSYFAQYLKISLADIKYIVHLKNKCNCDVDLARRMWNLMSFFCLPVACRIHFPISSSPAAAEIQLVAWKQRPLPESTSANLATPWSLGNQLEASGCRMISADGLLLDDVFLRCYADGDCLSFLMLLMMC